MANAEGDDDVEDAEPQDVDNEAREMNDWAMSGTHWMYIMYANHFPIVKIIMWIVAMDVYKSKPREGRVFSIDECN